MKGDGRLVGYTEGPELILECGFCGERVSLLLYMMSGRLNCNADCRCPCGNSYYLKGRISRGEPIAVGGPRGGEEI